MKWATLICLFVFAIAAESRHLQKRHHEEHLGIAQLKKKVGDENFDYIVLVLLAQNLQKCSVEEHLKLVPEFDKLADHCGHHPEEEKCKKSPMALFYDLICATESLDHGYSWLKECCGKDENERHKCFVEHRDVEVEPYKIPDITIACNEHHDHPKLAFQYIIVEEGRRHSGLYAPIVLGFAKNYIAMTGECCAAEDRGKCFGERMPEIKKKTDYVEAQNKHKCLILDAFTERATQSVTLAKLSQKFPKANHEELLKTTHETVHVTKDCCHDDSVECMVDKLHLIEHMCEAKAKLSSKLDECCDKPILERSGCIYNLPNDDPPADLPNLLAKYVENDHVCKDYENNKDGFMAEFVHDFAIHHTESHYLTILRAAKGYEGVLIKCCAGDNPPECYKVVPQMLEAGLEKAHKLSQENCEDLHQHGAQNYKLAVLGRYTRKMPQVSEDTLIEMAIKMTKIATKCCALPEKQIQPCGEEKLDLLLGKMCLRESKTFINDNVRDCCKQSYVERRPCFTGLDADPKYVAPALDVHVFDVGEELCKGSEEEQDHKKLELFVKVIKQKLDIEKDKVKEIVGKFRGIAQKCCAEHDHKECFDAERPALVELVTHAIAH